MEKGVNMTKENQFDRFNNFDMEDNFYNMFSDDIEKIMKDIERERKDQLKAAKAVLKENPDDLIAKMEVATFSSKNIHQTKERYEDLLLENHEQMKKDGVIDESSIGDYWLIFETRPYMIVKFSYFKLLADLRMLKKAIREGEHMIELSSNDNLGVRFHLAHLYALLEDEEGALKLVEKFGKDEIEIVLALALLYFKLDQLDKAKSFLKQAQKMNSHTRQFIRDVSDGGFIPRAHEGGYPFNSYEQLEAIYSEVDYVYEANFEFLLWADTILKKRKK